MQEIGAILMGLSLAACAGLRAFLPLLALGIGVRMNWWPVEGSWSWIGSNEALIGFGVATAAEIIADKIPVVDHALDSFGTIARPIAGALAAAGAIWHLSPAYAVALGIILGAPLAAGFHVSKAGTRLASTGMTLGTANPVLSFVEDAVALIGVILAIFVPVLAVAVLASVAFAFFRWMRRRIPRQRGGMPA